MKKMFVIAGVLMIIIGVTFIVGGQVIRSSANSFFSGCISPAGLNRSLNDTDYSKQCEDAASQNNFGSLICIGGLPLIIAGVIVMILGFRNAPPQYVQQPMYYYQQPVQQYAPAPSYQQPPTTAKPAAAQRPKAPKSVPKGYRCPHCGAVTNPGDELCTSCGEHIT